VQIRSIRIGAATNSSSTHSVIFYNGAPLGDNPVDEDGYGWEQFTLVSPEAKLDYLNAQWATATLGWEERGKEGFRYVDHQSLWQWPKLNGKADRRVFELVKRELLKDGVVILGGNDNSGEHHLYATQRAVPLFEVLRNGTGVKIREDPVGKWITVLAAHTYDSPTGIKFRLGDGEIKKSYTPELMDIKVTDYCRVGCDFCYQGSTPQGRHAPWDRLQRAVVILKQLDVMEVALGGGEPLEHPDIQDFTAELKKAGIVVNVTTKQKLAKGRWERESLIPGVNRFGMSIMSSKEVQEFSDVCYHVVLGTLPMSEVYNILMKADSTLLLDFKTTGRGAHGPRFDYSNWLEVVRTVKHNRLDLEELKYREWQVGIDTPLAKRSKRDLEAMGIPELTYETEEGKHSAYWDLVEDKFGPCSYEPDKLLDVPRGATKEWFREQFSVW